ncbi:MAG: TetR-like C-terminal domain-containing protein [Actinomycetota bacterium]
MNCPANHCPPCDADPRVERTRAAVTDAAAALLRADGPDAVTHANVAAAANVSRTTAYKHYPTRAALLRAAIESMENHDFSDFEFGDDLATDLRNIFSGFVIDLADVEQSKLMATMMLRALHDTALAEVRDGFMAELRPVINEAFGRAITRGELRDDLDLELAWRTVAGSLVFTRFLTSDPVDDEFLERVIDYFIAANAP